MGKGNICTHREYEGLFYVDTCYFAEYLDKETGENVSESNVDFSQPDRWEYDEFSSEKNWGKILDEFCSDFKKLYPSFDRVAEDTWLDDSLYASQGLRVIMENKLFSVCVAGNEWSMAVMLIQKQDEYDEAWHKNLQYRFHDLYLDGIKHCLLCQLPSIGTYAGAWTSGRLTREEYFGEAKDA